MKSLATKVYTCLLLLSVTVACGGEDTEPSTGGTSTGGSGGGSSSGGSDGTGMGGATGGQSTTGGSSSAGASCKGGGSCEDFNENECTAAGLWGLGCTTQRENSCVFGSVISVPGNDPGCATKSTLSDCVGFSTGCYWTGSACTFKACDTLSTESACDAVNCVWHEGSCYFNDCASLSEGGCAGAHGCGWAMNAFAGCSGTFSCADLDAGTFDLTDQELCDAAEQSALPCSWE